MHWLIVAVFGLSAATAQASDILKMFVPSPAAVVITVGRWIYEQNRKDPIYEVVVQGSGSTESEAREQAFRLAVNEAVGSLMLSQTEVVDQELARHQIINYSSGYVHGFDILGLARAADGTVTVQMRVWVKRSVLVNGMFGSSRESGVINGPQAAESLRSLLREHETGDRLLAAVLEKFPAQAFDITQIKTQFSLDSQRRATVWVEFDIAWHREYLDSLAEAFTATSQVSPRDSCYHYNIRCSDRYYYARVARDDRNRYTQSGIYTDQARWQLIKQHLLDSWPVIKIDVRSGLGTTVHSVCYRHAALNPVAAGVSDRYGNGPVEISNPNFITVNAWQKNRYRIRVGTADAQTIDSMDAATVSVVPWSTCSSPPTFAP